MTSNPYGQDGLVSLRQYLGRNGKYIGKTCVGGGELLPDGHNIRHQRAMKRVAVIGGGVAGMQTALRLAEQGIEPVIIEKEAELGGKPGFPGHVLFPSFTPASEILTELRRRRVAEREVSRC